MVKYLPMAFHFCPNCGAKLQFAEAEICPGCGVRIKPPPPSPGEIYAGFWTRVFAYAIDTLILAVPGAAIFLFITMNAVSDAMDAFSGVMAPLSGDMISPQSFQTDYTSLLGPLLGTFFLSMVEAGAIVLAMRWIYFAYLESSPRQATFGKAALGLMVIDGGGNRLSFARATGRWLGKLISWATFGLGFSIIGFTGKRQGLHDLIADTSVVHRNRYSPPPPPDVS
jgi:uncharacterized RDD family membrane protein YckC